MFQQQLLMQGSGFFYQSVLKKIFFQLDPERVHSGMVHFGELLGRSSMAMQPISSLYGVKDKMLEQQIFGIDFKNSCCADLSFENDRNLGTDY